MNPYASPQAATDNRSRFEGLRENLRFYGALSLFLLPPQLVISAASVLLVLQFDGFKDNPIIGLAACGCMGGAYLCLVCIWGGTVCCVGSRSWTDKLVAVIDANVLNVSLSVRRR